MTPQSFLSIEIVFIDDDVAELRLSVSDRFFSGAATVMETPEFVGLLLRGFSGFPAKPDDEREINLQDIWGKCAATINLRCSDSVGHAIAAVMLSSDGTDHGTLPARVEVAIPINAALVDAFVEDIRGVRLEPGSRLVLNAAA